jgi:hypothetical protein
VNGAETGGAKHRFTTANPDSHYKRESVLAWTSKNSPLLPVLSALSFSLIGSLLWMLLESSAGALGGASSQPDTDGFYVALLFLQIGYFVASVPLLRRTGLQCLDSLSGQLKDDEGLQGIVVRFRDRRQSGLYRAVLPALALTLATQEVQFARFSSWWSQPDWALGEVWTVLSAWTTWSLAFWLVARVIVDVNAIRRLGRDHVVIDLMRIEPLIAFSRYGLQLAALIIGIMALWAISASLLTAVFAPESAETSGQIVLLMLVIYLAITMAAFVYPQLGIRRNMRGQKHLVAEQITSQLPYVKNGLLDTGTDADRIASLLAVRSHIQSLPDWPIGQHTRVRLTLYLFIPLLSWVAAALVEEFVSRLLM